MIIAHTVYRSAIGSFTDEQCEAYRAACESALEAMFDCPATVRLVDDGPSACDTKVTGFEGSFEGYDTAVARIREECDRVYYDYSLWAE